MLAQILSFPREPENPYAIWDTPQILDVDSLIFFITMNDK